ncbi:MAG TPA: 1-(5-phosphoribosyl)-5-[(5-phosphoribosylamino)methylideneamino] imidazole-4-carboxamide isomerase [Cytophagaceae bacterium]
MIEIIPAISIVANKVARYNHCDINDVTVYEEAPLDMAKKFEDHGIKRLHLIDLDGAKSGKLENVHVLEMIAGFTNLTIDFGGGISYDDDVRFAFENGASTIHAASVAVKDREMFSSWVISYGRNKVILAVDAINEKVATRGWSRSTDINLMELLEYYHNQGVMYVKCTDIGKDDQLSGPSFDLYKKILNKFPDIKLFASGGVTSVEDIERLQDLGVYGVIFAKAYYEGKIKLKDLEKFLV